MVSTVVEVETGPRAGHKLWLRTYQSATVGRSEYADFSFHHDANLAPIHFSIDSDLDSVQLLDLTGTSSTRVNGYSVTSQPIHHGDCIEAGSTRMRVRIESDRVAVHRERQPYDDRDTGYEARIAGNGMRYYAGRESAPAPAEVLQMLSGPFHKLLLVNPHKFEGPLPDADNSQRTLRIPDRPNDKLLVYSFDEPIDLTRLIGDIWDCDAACCLLSNHRGGGTIKRLRYVSASYLRPSLLRSQLLNSPISLVTELMPELSGILAAATDATWHLYPHPTMAPSWEHVGLPAPPMQKRESLSV